MVLDYIKVVGECKITPRVASWIFGFLCPILRFNDLIASLG